MNTNLFSILQKVADKQGTDIFDNPKRLQGVLADMAVSEPKAERKALIKCFELGFYTELKNNGDKIMLVRRLQNEEGFTSELCESSVEIIASLVEALRPKPEAPVEKAPIAETPAEIGGQAQASAETQAFTQYAIMQHLQELRVRDDEIKQLKEALQKTKSGLGTAIVLGAFTIVISVGVGVAQYNGLMAERNGLFYKNESLTKEKIKLQTEKGQLQTEKSQLQTDKNQLNRALLSFLNVTSIKVGNYGNGWWITRPGGSLRAGDMRYLDPAITYNSLVSGQITLHIKIIDPYGEVFRNASISPTGYSYSYKAGVSRGNNQSLELSGWGRDDRSSYWAGQWTVEVWYEGVCLRSEKVRLD